LQLEACTLGLGPDRQENAPGGMTTDVSEDGSAAAVLAEPGWNRKPPPRGTR
jgi:hypothetical protein